MATPSNLVLCEIGETQFSGLDSYSPFCLKVHRALRALGLAYARRHGAQPGSFKKLNPAAQVPVLLIDARAVTDSTAIVVELQRLAGRSLEGGGSPREVGEVWLWEELGDSCLYGFVLASRWADDRNWHRFRDTVLSAIPGFLRPVIGSSLRRKVVANIVARDIWRAGPDACWTRFCVLLDQFERRAPVQGYWASPALSVADLAIFAQLHSLRNSLTPWQAEQIAARIRLSEYLDRIDEETAATATARSPGARNA